jgi:hypothetical protein
VTTGLAFAAFKLWTPAGDVYRVGLAALRWPPHAIAAFLHGDGLPALGRVRLTPDPTDLLALPALMMSPQLLVRSAACCPFSEIQNPVIHDYRL